MNTLEMYLFKTNEICFPEDIEYRMFLDFQCPQLESFGYRKTIHTLTLRKRYSQKTSRCGTEMGAFRELYFDELTDKLT